MLKLLGCICIIAATGQLGFAAAKNKLSFCKDLKRLRCMLAELKPMLQCGCTLKEIAQRLACNDDYSAFGMKDIDLYAVDIRKQIIDSIQKAHALDDELKELCCRLFSRLGADELQGQLLAVDMALSQLDEKISAQQEGLGEKIKLYKAMGVLFGTFIVILLI